MPKDDLFESVDSSEELTDQAVFEHLSESFVILENLLTGAKTSKHNLEKIYELLESIKTITGGLKESLVSLNNINQISDNMLSLDKTLREWAIEESKMITVLSSVINEQKQIKDIILKQNKIKIIENDDKKDSGDKSYNMNTILLFVILFVVIGGKFV